tara:strand:- start:369 stop:842 length:474 start_codon:yes stop_codon:yes gene_type:complete
MVEVNDRVVATNRRARRQFEILDSWEAGIVLQGSEVKSLRESKVEIAEAYVRPEKNELWLVGLYITAYSRTGNKETGHDPERPRKLLLHRSQIIRITERVNRENLTVIPLRLYFSHGLAKVEIALARGRRIHDQRQAIAKKEADREAQRAIARHRRR